MQRSGDVQSAVVPAARQRRAALGPDLRAVRRARRRSDRAARERVRRGGHGELAGVGRPPLGGLGATRATPCACPSAVIGDAQRRPPAHAHHRDRLSVARDGSQLPILMMSGAMSSGG